MGQRWYRALAIDTLIIARNAITLVQRQLTELALHVRFRHLSLLCAPVNDHLIIVGWALPRDWTAAMISEVDRYATHRQPIAGVKFQPALYFVAVGIVHDRAVVEAGLTLAGSARFIRRVHPLALVVHLIVQIALGELFKLLLTTDRIFGAASMQRVLVNAVIGTPI